MKPHRIRFGLGTLLVVMSVIALIFGLNVRSRELLPFKTTSTDLKTGAKTPYRVTVVEKGWPLTHLRVQTFHEMSTSTAKTTGKPSAASGNHWSDERLWLNIACWVLCLAAFPMFRYARPRKDFEESSQSASPPAFG